MSTIRLLAAEILHRKTNFALSLCAVLAAATLFVAGPTLVRGYGRESQSRLQAMQRETEEKLVAMQRETDNELHRMQQEADKQLVELDTRTKRTMRDLGFNLRIVHRDTDMTQLYANLVALDMPEEYVQRLAESTQITKIVHLVATLLQMIEWEGQPRLLIGFAPEATQSHLEEKTPMGYQIELGAVFLGAETGKKHKVGEEVEILGKRFQVAQILPPHGRREEDIAILMHLKDAQQVLKKPNRISEIVALGCKCKTANRIEEITSQLEAVLPEAKVTEHRLNAIAREEQRNLVQTHYRQTMSDYKGNRKKILDQEIAKQEEIVAREKEQQEKIAGLLDSVTRFVTPLIVLACSVWVGLLALANVRERRTEIGLLRALGKGSGNIASLLLCKAVLLGLLGGSIGALIGYAAARWLAFSLLDVASANFTPQYGVLAATILGAPLLSAMASYLPALAAITQDPAVVLQNPRAAIPRRRPAVTASVPCD